MSPPASSERRIRKGSRRKSERKSHCWEEKRRFHFARSLPAGERASELTAPTKLVSLMDCSLLSAPLVRVCVCLLSWRPEVERRLAEVKEEEEVWPLKRDESWSRPSCAGKVAQERDRKTARAKQTAEERQTSCHWRPSWRASEPPARGEKRKPASFALPDSPGGLSLIRPRLGSARPDPADPSRADPTRPDPINQERLCPIKSAEADDPISGLHKSAPARPPPQPTD